MKQSIELPDISARFDLKFRIGISGWTYRPWRGVFYPKGLVQNQELRYASRRFNSIEINGTHYSLQRPSSFEKWFAETPDDFIFSLKGSRFITHMKKLADVTTALPNFMASGVLALREKLGPFLWQLPPAFQFNAERIERFFAGLPRTTHEAAALAARHDERLEGRQFLEPGPDRPLRHAMEVRHESFMTPVFFKLLRQYNIAFVFADSAGLWPYAEDLTSDFIYIRLHGAEQLYSSGYTDAALDHWAARLRFWIAGKPAPKAKLVVPADAKRVQKINAAYVYFDNDIKVRAPFDAAKLRARLT